MTERTIMLVHGACHGPWCWDRVVPLLKGAGYRVLVPELPGRGQSGKPGWRWSLKAYADAVVDAARMAGGPMIAVGHSMGGIVNSAAAESAPDQFERLVYVSGFLPMNGDSLGSIAAMDKTSDLHGASSFSWLTGAVTIKPDQLAPVYCGDCSAADVAWVKTRIVGESVRPSITKVNLTQRFQSIPRSYIRCTQDRALSIEMQDRLIERQPCDRVATVDSSHSPFLSMPDQFVAALLTVI